MMEEERNKRIKGLTKALHIITKICRIFMILGVVGLAIGLVTVPAVASSIKVNTNKQTIKIFDETFKYEKTDDKIVISTRDKDDKTEIVKENEVKAFDEIINWLEDNNLVRVVVGIELSLLFAGAVVVLMYFAFKEIDKVFVNISSGEKPFTKEHSEYMIKTAKYVIAMLIVEVVASIVTNIVFTSDIGFDIKLTNIIVVVVLYTLAYIFEYGHELEEKAL